METKDRTYRIMLSGGGTGGHIYPAIAIADALKTRFPKASFLFVGAQDRMEMQRVPQAGYAIEGLWISGIQRRLTLKNLSFPFKLLSSLWRAHQLIKRFKPDMVIGTGGFASGPLLYMASLKKIPSLIQEQNSYPGITNKLLAKRVQKICVAHSGLGRFFPKEKIIITGNPVRQALLNPLPDSQTAKTHFQLKPETTTLLVIGGSLGAKRINELIAAELAFFESQGVQLIWQCGKLYYQQYRSYQSARVRVCEYLNDMAAAYASADIIISRAGASSVSELAIIGKPVIFIPSPNVAEDHQTKNAMTMVNKGAALLIKESDLETNFENLWRQLLQTPELQKTLSETLKKEAKPAATQAIADAIQTLLEG